jgi:hypothetical protein
MHGLASQTAEPQKQTIHDWPMSIPNNRLKAIRIPGDFSDRSISNWLELPATSHERQRRYGSRFTRISLKYHTLRGSWACSAIAPPFSEKSRPARSFGRTTSAGSV